MWAVYCSALWAQENGPRPASPTADMTAATIKMMASLALIVGIIVLMFYLLKRFKGLARVASEGPRMRIVGSLPIAPKRSVTVVEVEGKWLVLGVGSESVNFLCSITPTKPETEKNQPINGSEGAFQKILQRKRSLIRKSSQGEQEL